MTIRLSWQSNSFGAEFGFRVQRFDSTLGWTSEADTALGVTQLDVVVGPGLHQYRVFTIGEGGNLYGPSNEAAINVLAGPSNLVITPLG